MLNKIDEMIEKYKIGLKGSWLILDPQLSGTMYLIHEQILSDLNKLRDLISASRLGGK